MIQSDPQAQDFLSPAPQDEPHAADFSPDPQDAPHAAEAPPFQEANLSRLLILALSSGTDAGRSVMSGWLFQSGVTER